MREHTGSADAAGTPSVPAPDPARRARRPTRQRPRQLVRGKHPTARVQPRRAGRPAGGAVPRAGTRRHRRGGGLPGRAVGHSWHRAVAGRAQDHYPGAAGRTVEGAHATRSSERPGTWPGTARACGGRHVGGQRPARRPPRHARRARSSSFSTNRASSSGSACRAISSAGCESRAGL